MASSSSSSNFQCIFNASLQAYNSKTKNNLLDHPLAAQLQSCDSPDAVLTVLQDLVQKFDQRRTSDERLKNWLDPTVNVLYAFSATLGDGVGLVFPSGNAIFAGIGVLLLAAKDVNASQDILIDLFERIGRFFKRLESYTERTPSEGMTDMMVEVMVEVLSVLAVVTVEIKQKRRKKFLKKLLGRNDVEDALKKLDKLTGEEAKMATAEVLKSTRNIDTSPEKFLKKLLGRNDVEDALKKLDKLTGEEAKMATAEVLKSTRNIDDNVKMLIDDDKEARATLQRERRKQTRQDLHSWLSLPDSSTNHNIACNAHHDGTATWFFQGSMFEKWRSTPSLLWIHGKPGPGKSVLCSGIIEDIKALQKAQSACLAYFYCDFRDKDKQGRRNLVFSILWQLAAQSDLCCGFLSRLHSEHDGVKRQPSDGTLTRCLKEILLLPTQSSVYLIIDALDECPNSSGMPTPREEVLDLIQDLVDLQLPNLHLCVTSRPEIDIRTTLEPLTSLHVSLHDQSGQTKDIVDYVSSVVSSDKKMRRWRDEDKTLIITTLSERASGMFRWVYCQLERLRHCLPPSVRGILDDLPDTLDETYERVLKDFNKANQKHAIRLLHCLTFAIRPLRVEELAEVLAVDFDAAQQGGIPKLNLNWRWADHHEAVLSTCSSLIMIVEDGDSQVVQFLHFSVKEYLTSDRLANASRDVSCYHILPESAHTILAQACLGVLLRLDDHVDEGNAGEIPLANYAAEHWVDHARFKDVASRVQGIVEVLFDVDKPHHAACLRLHWINQGSLWGPFTDDDMPRGSLLYYASFYGLYDLAKHLAVKHPEHVNARGGRLVSPLGAALYRKHFEVAELLHEHGADVNVRGNYEMTLLHVVSRQGLVDTARWLLNHSADANAQMVTGGTPLHLATINKYLEIVRMLLDHNADIHAQNNSGEVALHLAAYHYLTYHDINILQLLLDHGVDVNARDNEGSTPLHHPSYRRDDSNFTGKGSVEGTRLLLEHGASMDAENNKGETAFQVALEEGHHEMVEFLWGLGIEYP